MFVIRKKSDNRGVRAFTHKLADIAGGVNIATADLTQSVLPEGTPIGRDSNGLYHVVKTAVLTANAANDATTYTVKKGHNFKVGDIIMAKTSGKAYAITTIATNSGNNAYDDITVGTTLGVAVTAGDVLMQAASAGASGSAFKYQPLALTGEAYDVHSDGNIFANAWLIGVVKEANLESPINDTIKAAISGIKFM